jgi:hypothetical protein
VWVLLSKWTEVRFLFVVSVVAAVLFPSVCLGGRSGNLEYWQTTGISLDINKDLAIHAEQEFRAGRHNGNPYLHNVNLGLVYKSLAKGMDIGFDFKKEYEKDSTGKFRQENRPHLNITFRGKLFDFSASDRIRLEYRNREKKEDLFRLRNKATVKLPLRLTKLNLQPYIAEEVFINLGEDNINQNRLSAGFSCELAKNTEVSVYYLWKTSKISDGWEDTNVVGVGLMFRF